MNIDFKKFDLPIVSKLDAIVKSMEEASALILQAEPGAGKTTLVPIALLKSIPEDKKIILLEPRRIAARNAAERMAEMLGEQVGATIGYRIRNEQKISSSTRIEVITEGILTRMLQGNPELPGVGLIIFDEFHERNLDGDLGLAFTVEVMESLRDDLKVLLMSATLDNINLEHILPNASVIKCQGRSYPVTLEYLSGQRDQLSGWQNTLNYAVEKALTKTKRHILIFLPGQFEIRRARESIESSRLDLSNIEIAELYGSLPFRSQRMAIFHDAKSTKRKIILSTNIAESSLTIEGVDCVIDSGLVRQSTFEPRVGFNRLSTVRVSAASAKQRQGRAGRLAAGHCIRLWGESQSLRQQSEPEILRSDMTTFALELANWGVNNSEDLSLLDQPKQGSFNQAQELLVQLGALDKSLRITAHGKTILNFGIHPRLGHMILSAKDEDDITLACMLAALVEEQDVLVGTQSQSVDFILRLEQAIQKNVQSNVLSRVRKQYLKLAKKAKVNEDFSVIIDDGNLSSNSARLLATAFPDRVAKKRGGGYLLRNGTGAEYKNSHDELNEFIVVVQLGGQAKIAKIFQSIQIEKFVIESIFSEQLEEVESVKWEPQTSSVKAERVTRLGAIVLESKPITNVDETLIVKGVVEGIKKVGLENLAWSETTKNLMRKVYMLRTTTRFRAEFPNLEFEHLAASMDDWLAPFLSGIKRLSDVSSELLDNAIRSVLSYEQAQKLEFLLPDKLKVASGSNVKIDYLTSDKPVLAVKLQEMFGESDTPKIADGEISLIIHLLSPAQRPLQITEDLASFWANGYESVKKEMKGKYPKHPWPDDPLTAQATRFTKKKMH